MEIPPDIERAIEEEVARNLQAELDNRGLLLAAGALAEAEAGVAERGTRLLTRAISVCYPTSRQSVGAVTIQFEGEASEARLGGALAFGACTANVLLAGRRPFDRPTESIELLCALFNLGIGLIDALCDTDAETGRTLLELIQSHDLSVVAEESRLRGWLSGGIPPALADDAEAAFTVEVVEAFFKTLHVEYPHDAGLRLRRRVGIQLGEALVAERQSLGRPADRVSQAELIASSRGTSVLPFEIIETLACVDEPSTEPTAGTQLGEAMWRIDDLVDLCDDARSGALNGILLTAAAASGRPTERDRVAALERLLESREIASSCGEAAERLLIGLRLACPGPQDPASDPRAAEFLSFIQRYAAIQPRPAL